MSKTIITINDVQRDPRGSADKAATLARQQARFHVINAKRGLSGHAAAYVDGRLVDGGVEARTDVKVKA